MTRCASAGVYYRYDTRGRLARAEICDNENVNFPPGWRPTERVHRIDYGYEPDGKLGRVTAYTNTQYGPQPVADNVFEYDDRRNLTSETQQHFALADGNSPVVGRLMARRRGWRWNIKLSAFPRAFFAPPAFIDTYGSRSCTSALVVNA